MKKSYIFLAPGFEEIEALATVDVLRRAGMEVVTVAITTDESRSVKGAHGVTVEADILPSDEDMREAEWLICPGGMPGAANLAASETVTTLLMAQAARGGNIAAICASPSLVLTPLGLLDGLDATCYPGMEPKDSNVHMTGERVVALDTIVTGNGPSSTIPFALAIVEKSCGKQAAADVAAGMLC